MIELISSERFPLAYSLSPLTALYIGLLDLSPITFIRVCIGPWKNALAVDRAKIELGVAVK